MFGLFQEKGMNFEEAKALVLPMLMLKAQQNGGVLKFTGTDMEAIKENTDYGWDRNPESGDMIFWIKPCTGENCGEPPAGVIE